MAQTFVYNTNELSPQGYLKPANTVSAVSPDNVTHLQLRYSDFSSSYVIQGSVVSGENSTFEFSIADNLASEIFKMYYSTDGTTYTVDKTFGGTSGKKLFATADLSGLVTLTTAQNISGTKTINGSANLVIASGSDITVQSGGDITLADAPSASTDATNKAYVDANTFKSCVFWIDAMSYNNSTVALSYRRIFNNTGVTPTLAYGTNAYGEAGLTVTFNRTSSAFDIQTMPANADDGGFSTTSGVNWYIDPLVTQSSANTSAFLVHSSILGSSVTIGYVAKELALDVTTATTSHGYDHKEYTLDMDNGGFANYIRSISSGTAGATAQGTVNLKNGRIELRFYD